MALTYATYDAWTTQFWGQREVQDNIHRSSAFLKAIEPHIRKEMLSKTIDVPLRYARPGGGGWYNVADQLSNTTGEIGTKARFGAPAKLQKPILLNNDDVELNKGNAIQVADILEEYTKACIEDMSETLALALLTAQAGAAPYSYLDALGDGTYGGIAVADMPKWRSFIIEPAYAAPSTAPISPSLKNLEKALILHELICGRKVDLIVTTPAMWMCYYDQINLKLNINTTPTGTMLVKYGFNAFEVLGVPVIADTRVYSEAFVADSANRAAACGHQVLGINQETVYPIVHATRSYAWRKKGWSDLDDFDKVLNRLYWWGHVICNERRANFRMFGLDPTQAAGSYTQFDEATMSNWAILTA